jgi:hypothetical protein
MIPAPSGSHRFLTPCRLWWRKKYFFIRAGRHKVGRPSTQTPCVEHWSVVPMRFLWYNIKHLWHNVKHLWYNVKHLRTTPNKISRKSHCVDAFWTMSNICEIFVRRCFNFMKMVRAAKCRTFMKHYETTSNKISWNLIMWTHTHSLNICEIFMRFLFDVVSWVFFDSSYQTSWNNMKHYQTKSHKNLIV